MKAGSEDSEQREVLRQRVGRVHLQQRLGIERDYERRVFGQGRNLFHIENWYSIHSMIRNTLRLFMLHGRGRRNARDIRLRTNNVYLNGLPDAFAGYRVLQISDLHLDMAPDFPHALIEAVRRVDYDLCVITGDFRANTFGDWLPAIDAMRRVRVHLHGDVYGILGNHDTIRMVPALEARWMTPVSSVSTSRRRCPSMRVTGSTTTVLMVVPHRKITGLPNTASLGGC